MSDLYVFDTNVFINAWHRYYPVDVFPGVWEHIERLLCQRQIAIHQMIYEEIACQKDTLSEWVDFFVGGDAIYRPDEEMLRVFIEIVERYEDRFIQVRRIKSRSGADPWVIATALLHHGVVVTDERLAPHPLKKINIPDVCNELGVGCITPAEFLRRTKYTAPPSSVQSVRRDNE